MSSQDRDRYSSQALRARNSELHQQPWADFGTGTQEPETLFGFGDVGCRAQGCVVRDFEDVLLPQQAWVDVIPHVSRFVGSSASQNGASTRSSWYRHVASELCRLKPGRPFG